MKVNDQKPNAQPPKHRSRSAAPVKAGSGTQTGPKNRRCRSFRDWPAPVAAQKVHRADRAEQLEHRRERARRIVDLPLEYVPSRDFHRPSADKRIVVPMPVANAVARRVRAQATPAIPGQPL